jgi:amidophosphoribosyltransferase
LLTKDAIYAFRDRCGVRPLSIGKLKNGYIVSSETCAFDMVGGELVRDVKPGELVRINGRGIKSWQLQDPDPKLEVFEFIYFARPDSVLAGKLVNEVRRELGKQLAKEFPAEADLVVPVPDSAIPAALGYANTLQIEFDHGLIKNRYIHRTFIAPTQELRERAVHMKLNPLPDHLKGKRVVLVDDSIVRGTTMSKIVAMLRRAGASEVHVRISSPPIRFPDFYGIDTPNQTKLIASHKTIAEICDYTKADSLEFLSYNGMINAIGVPEDKLCCASFSGIYPVDLGERISEITFDQPWSLVSPHNQPQHRPPAKRQQ